MAKAASKASKKKAPAKSLKKNAPTETPKTKKSAEVPSSATKTSAKAPAQKKKASGKKSSAKKAAGSEPRVVQAELLDADDDASGESLEAVPVFDGDLADELPALDAAIDIDPDREVGEEEIRAVAAKASKKPRRVKAELVDDENDSVEHDDEHSEDESDDRGPVRRARKAPGAPSESKAVATTTDPISVYLAEIRRYPLLTKEQEQELAIKYRETGDSKAAELLVTSNLRFVVKIAAEYSRFGAKLIDLVQEGNVGLMHAVREFNPYRGVRLITYAVWWIRGYIQEYLMRQYSLVRIGTTQNQRKLFYRLQKERDALGSLGVQSTNALLAGRLGVSEEEVETMSKRLSGRDVSLSQPVDSSGQSSASLLDFEPSADVGVDDQIGHLEEMEVLKDNLEKLRPLLNEKETYILEKRILADDPMTLQEIGEHYGVTREAVRQLEARLINRIRTAVTHQLDGDEE